MPNNIIDPITREKEDLAAAIAEQLRMVTPSERVAVAVACEVHDDTVLNYGKRVKRIPIARRILAELKKVTVNRRVAV